MKISLPAIATTLVAIAGSSLLFSVEADAAVINFSYDFTNSQGSLSGTVEGDVGSDGFSVTNLSNLNATFSGLSGVTFNQFVGSGPIFRLGTISTAPSPSRLFFTLSDGGLSEFQVNSFLPGQRAYLVSPPTTFVQDSRTFGTWNASVAAPVTSVPEPASVIGLLVVAGYLAPKFTKRRSEKLASEPA